MKYLLQVAAYSLVALVVAAAFVATSAFLAQMVATFAIKDFAAGVSAGILVAFCVYMGNQFAGGDDEE